jgi:hypothetical protein
LWVSGSQRKLVFEKKSEGAVSVFTR